MYSTPRTSATNHPAATNHAPTNFGTKDNIDTKDHCPTPGPTPNPHAVGPTPNPHAVDMMLKDGAWHIKTRGMFEIVSDAHTYYFSTTLRNGKTITNPFAPTVMVRGCRMPETYRAFEQHFPTTGFCFVGEPPYF